MNKDQAIAFLNKDGGMVPCSRYGRHSEDCAPVAFALAEIAQEANGDEITTEALDYYMGLVVNDHDDVEALILAHGTDEHRSLLDYLPTENPYATGKLPMPDVFGGVSLFAVMDDGGTLCEACVIDPTNPVHADDGSRDGWGVVGFDTTGNTDGGVTCDNCAKVLQEDDDEYVSRCPACGSPIDYCQGHGEIGDPTGWAILQAHDNGDHDGCNEEGCDER